MIPHPVEITSIFRLRVSGPPYELSELEQAVLQLETNRRIPFSLNFSGISREAMLQIASDLSEPFDEDEEIEFELTVHADNIQFDTSDDEEIITMTGRIIPTHLIDIEED